MFRVDWFLVGNTCSPRAYLGEGCGFKPSPLGFLGLRNLNSRKIRPNLIQTPEIHIPQMSFWLRPCFPHVTFLSSRNHLKYLWAKHSFWESKMVPFYSLSVACNSSIGGQGARPHNSFVLERRRFINVYALDVCAIEVLHYNYYNY